MTKRFRSLRTRLLASHVAVVLVGLLTMLIMGNRLAPTFVDEHLQTMETTMGGSMGHNVVTDLEEGIFGGFDRALLAAGAASTAAALLVAAFASGRLLRPLEAVGRATRRLAGGSYGERVSIPAESELAALAEDVNELAAALQDTEQRRIQLISELAHELRTPLATIKGYMEGLTDGVFEPTEEIFAAAGREATRLERLATDLSTLSRFEGGRLDLQLAPAHLGAIAREVAVHLEPQFRDQAVDLVVVDQPRIPVVVDADRIAQVFTNILGNALSYTPSGGRVEISGGSDKTTAWVTVSDTGKGIDPSQLEAVFDRFFRGERSAPGGTGIGLTIARRIARLHGGDVTAHSDGPGTGSSFT
ncbi:MAG: HAMP domain-containing histidine kinase, partial [Acidimicrobiia bacterium]|nr:HAMP domain-containing histidine kinase [Acidimicrobiia bacterium]